MTGIPYRPRAILCSLALLVLSSVAAAADRPYREGPVYDVAAIRTVDGMFDDYMAWLAGPWKQFMEAQKKAGVIMDYEVYLAFPRGPNDADLYLITEYKNMAAFDGLDDKVEPIMETTLGNRQKANADSIARGKMRTVLGSELVRRLELK